MTLSTGKGILLLYGVLISLLMYGLLEVIITTVGGRFLYLELFGFLFFVLLALTGFVLHEKLWGKRAFFFLFILHLANIVVLWYVESKIYGALLFFAVLGFIFSLPRNKEKQNDISSEMHTVVFDKPGKSATAAAFSPGKYVASARSNNYHEPKCDWAKKIAEERRIWFRGKEEAWEKGYKAHDCVT